MSLFHRHTFDPEKWALQGKSSIFQLLPSGEHLIQRARVVYKNTCKICGDLVFRVLEVGVDDDA